MEGKGGNIDSDMSVGDASSDIGQEFLRLAKEECMDPI